MLKILLVCNAGMSTSMLVQKMEKYAQSEGIECQIEAKPLSVAEKEIKDWDVVMLGPQVRHQLGILTKAANGEPPIEVINMRDYGMMNGENVFKAAQKLLNK